jgi:hypothetical protein
MQDQAVDVRQGQQVDNRRTIEDVNSPSDSGDFMRSSWKKIK